MRNTNKLNWKYQLKSIGWAISGLSYFFRTEVKPWIHLITAVLVIILGIFLNISRTDWLFIIGAIAIVFLSELLNTIIERLADYIPDKEDKIRGRIKDMSAGMVTISALLAIIVGMIVFYPGLLRVIIPFLLSQGGN